MHNSHGNRVLTFYTCFWEAIRNFSISLFNSFLNPDLYLLPVLVNSPSFLTWLSTFCRYSVLAQQGKKGFETVVSTPALQKPWSLHVYPQKYRDAGSSAWNWEAEEPVTRWWSAAKCMAKFKCSVGLMSQEAIRWALYQLQDLDTGDWFKAVKPDKAEEKLISGYVLLEHSSLERLDFKVCQFLCTCQ